MTPIGSADSGGVFASLWPAFAIVAFGFAIMLPEILTGLSLSDSHRFNLVWTEQFRNLVRAGELYPRWLPASWDGLGSPTFYFYPPIYFWSAALIDALTARLLPLEAQMSVTSAALLGASGLTMRLWLAAHVSRKTALIGALGYMAAPYHLYDIYGRGALAEACAYVFLPLIALAIRRIAEAKYQFLPLLALAYAALILSHLPSALLASLFLIPPFVLFCAATIARARIATFLAMTAAAWGFGIAVSASYLLPAIGLIPFISSGVLTASYFQPQAWFFWRLASWPNPAAAMLIMPLAGAVLLAVAGLARRSPPRRDDKDARFWLWLAGGLVVIISGAVPFLWTLPLLDRVQFPWRLFVVAEFALVTGVAMCMPVRFNLALRAATGVMAYCLVALVALVVLRAQGFPTSAKTEVDRILRDRREAPEYLPRGFPVPPGGNPIAIGLPPPAAIATAAAPQAKVLSEQGPRGALDVSVSSPAATTISVRRFYFPHWSVVDGTGRSVATRATSAERLLSWTAPAGRSAYKVRIGDVPLQRLGLKISLAGMVMLALFGFWRWWRGPRWRDAGVTEGAA